MHLERLAHWPTEWTEGAESDSGTITATKAALAQKRHMITHITVSSTAAPGAVLTVTVRSGTTVLKKFFVPTQAYAPIMPNFVRPLKGGLGELVSIECSNPTGVMMRVEIGGFTMLDP